MKSAYLSSGKVFEQVSMRQTPGLYQQLQAINPGELVVVRGSYDNIENLLNTMKVPYDIIDPSEMKSHNGGRVMFVNCKQYGNGNSVEAAQQFVEAGGRLVTTDWALSLVARAFPGKLKKVAETTDDVVEIRTENDIARRFVGLNYAQCHPQWWLETSSHIYDIGNGVQPLVTSAEMEAKYGKPYVVVAFAEGKGEVFHFISHLDLQRTRLKTKEDKGSLDDFLKKMKVERTDDMEEAKVAELEAAYSTLNTLAYLCIDAPIINTGMNSVVIGGAKSGSKSAGKSGSDKTPKSMRLA